ncbi:MAG: hypothetical protein R2834_10865 [Rhodothermales bacterium]
MPRRYVHRAGWSLCGMLLGLVLAGCALTTARQPGPDDLAKKTGFDWRADSTAHFVVYAERGSEGERRLEEVKRDVEASLVRVNRVLGAHQEEPRATIFLVDSRDRMRALIGHETNGIAFFKTRTLCYIVNERMMLSATHELLHVVAMNRWGTPERWVNEGLAVYATGNWHGHDLHRLAAFLGREGVQLSWDELTRSFSRHNDLITYPQAGSLIGFIYETYGVEAVEALWKDGAGGLQRVTGTTPDVIEASWKARLAQEPAEAMDYTYAP